MHISRNQTRSSHNKGFAIQKANSGLQYQFMDCIYHIQRYTTFMPFAYDKLFKLFRTFFKFFIQITWNRPLWAGLKWSLHFFSVNDSLEMTILNQSISTDRTIYQISLTDNYFENHRYFISKSRHSKTMHHSRNKVFLLSWE